jgi:hypothetical protein
LDKTEIRKFEADLRKKGVLVFAPILNTEIKGVGNWTVEMFLIFTLGREDVFSYGDLGLKKGFSNHDIDKLPDDLKRYAFLGLTLHHFEYIRKADAVFIYNKGGYMGNSITMELGVAEALGKPIFALEEDKDEPCRNVLIDFIVKTPTQLIKYLK